MAAITLTTPAHAGAGPNGTDIRPFYVIGHNPNTLAEAEDALKAGANALEPDVMVLPEDAVYLLPPPFVGAFLPDPDGLVVYHDYVYVTTRVPTTLEDYLDGLHQLAIDYPNLAMVMFDIKTQAAKPAYLQQIFDLVHTRLNVPPVNLNIIYNVGFIEDAKAAFTADLLNQLGAREGVQVDGDDHAGQVVKVFTDLGYTQNIGFGDGTSGPGPNIPRAVDYASYLRSTNGLPRTISDVWTIEFQSTMKFFIDSGADGIIPDFAFPPPQTLDPTYVESLVTVVTGDRADVVRMATPEDNPFQPLNQAYGVELQTLDAFGAGTDADLVFTLVGCNGTATLEYNTGYINAGYNSYRMEEDQTDWVTIPAMNLGRLSSLEIYNTDDSGLDDADWDLGSVKVASARWLQPNSDGLHQYTANYNGTIEAKKGVSIPLTPPADEPGATIQCPDSFTVPNDPDLCSAIVTFDSVASDVCPGVSAVSVPPSGSSFAVGNKVVSSTAIPSSGQPSSPCFFTVTVQDVQGPLVICPGPITVDATGPSGAGAFFAPSAGDNCGVASLTATPPSGSLFPIGTSTVTADAADAAGNHSTCAFTVHVKGAAEQTADLLTAVDNLAIKAGNKNALLAKLSAALAKLQSKNTAAACGPLGAFVNQVEALRGQEISAADADALIDAANQIRSVNGC